MAITEESQRYSCSTQQSLNAELLPPQKTQSGERPSGNTGDAIVVGIGKLVPRWDVIKQGPRELKYFVQVSGFPSPDRARVAAQAFQKGADMWNILEIGLRIVATTDAASAHFDVVYWEELDPNNGTLASAFFPNESNQNVWVYTRALQPRNIEILPAIFAHEIGHILGLRHEFAITGDLSKGLRPEGEGATQFMKSNEMSVMSYNFPPTIQDTDKEGIKAFYKLKNGAEIGGLPVTDFVPTLKKRT